MWSSDDFKGIINLILVLAFAGIVAVFGAVIWGIVWLVNNVQIILN